MKKNKLIQWNKKRFNCWAKRYDTSLLQLLLFKRTRKKIIYLIKSFLQKDNVKILDVACGTGEFLKKIQTISKGKVKLFGVDRSENMIEKAQKKSRIIKFKIAEAYSLPYKDNKFDVVTCSHAFHHFSGEFALREMKRVLKPGGILIIADGHKKGIWGKMLFSLVAIHERNVNHLDAIQMRKLYILNGFYQVIQFETNKLIPTLITIGKKHVYKK